GGTAEQPSDEGGRKGETEHRPVELYLRQAVQPRAYLADLLHLGHAGGAHEIDRSRRNGEAENAAERCQHEALYHEKPYEPTTARAERGAQRDLMLPSGGARQQEIGDIRTGNEEHASHRPKQRPK